MTDAEKPRRSQKGKPGVFQPGHPGGPGRPKGSLNKATIEAQRRLAEAGGSKVIATALRLAAQGEPSVVTALLKHVLPKQRTASTPFALPAGPLTESTLKAAAADVLRQVSEGEMTAAEGREALGVIEAARVIVLADALAERVEALATGAETAPSEEAAEETAPSEEPAAEETAPSEEPAGASWNPFANGGGR